LKDVGQKALNARLVVAFSSPPDSAISIELFEFLLRYSPKHSLRRPRNDSTRWRGDGVGACPIVVPRREISRRPQSAWITVRILVALVVLFATREQISLPEFLVFCEDKYVVMHVRKVPRRALRGEDLLP